MASRHGPTPLLTTTVNEPSGFDVAVPVPLLQVAVTAPTTGAPVAAVPFKVSADPLLPPPPPQAASNALPPRTKLAKAILFKRIFIIPLLKVLQKNVSD